MKFSGQLRELFHEYKEPIQYYLQINDDHIPLNQHIGKVMKLRFLEEINCIHCGRKVKKTYNNGSCYPCFIKLPQNDLCIVKPNLCHYDQGTCRDESFAKSQCLIPHYVYLALSSDVKVGITRKPNAYKRWIDQGAVQSIPIAEVPTRKMAGDLELFLTNHLPDKTNWRKMLKCDIAEADLLSIREEIKAVIPEEYQKYLIEVDQINEFTYSVLESLEKIKSFSLDKTPAIEGKLIGIKGQYILLDNGVFNMKKHTGYKVEVELVDSE